MDHNQKPVKYEPPVKRSKLSSSLCSTDNIGYNWSLTQLNAELPEELRSLPMLQGSDTSSLSTGTSAQNGLGGSSVSSGGDVLQRTQMLDVAGSQNHQQSSQLLAAAQSSAYGMPSVVSRHATIGVDCTTSATAATNIANPGNPQVSVPSAVVQHRLPGGCQQSVVTSAPQSATTSPEKLRLLQQQLVLLLHAHRCRRREQGMPMPGGNLGQPASQTTCQLPYCQTMKNVLKHLSECHKGSACKVLHCASSRQILTHWRYCTHSDCLVCLPLKNTADRRSSPAPVCQLPTAVGLPTPSSQLSDVFLANMPPPTDMVHAYQALGLPPPTQQQVAQAQRPTAPSSAGVARFPMVQQWTSSPMSTREFFADGSTSGQVVQMGSQPPTQPPQGVMGAAEQNALAVAFGSTVATLSSGVASTATAGSVMDVTPVLRPPVKDWHQSVGQDLRNHLVHKLVQAFYPMPVLTALRDVNNLVQYVRKVEGYMYETANSREEYYHLLAEKNYKIHKETEKRWMRQMQSEGGATAIQAGVAGTAASAQVRPTAVHIRMSGSRLFHAAGPATQNARWPRNCVVRGSTRSPRAAERRAAREHLQADGPSSVFGSLRASCAPLGADQSSYVPAAAVPTPTLSSSSVSQMGTGLTTQPWFTQMPATDPVDRSPSAIECSICFGPYNDSATWTLRCSHKFHVACIAQWLEKSETCPLCRADVD